MYVWTGTVSFSLARIKLEESTEKIDSYLGEHVPTNVLDSSDLIDSHENAFKNNALIGTDLRYYRKFVV